jgi:dephospho-CoA kinase
MFRVILTGGIASGKSAASAIFEELGIDVVDADEVSRELVRPGQPALAAIVREFGANVLRPDGTLDRRLLREQVFADPAKRLVLEDILHPRIHQRMQALAGAAASAYVVLVVPLLLESRQHYERERVLLIDVPEEIQQARLVARDASSREQVRQMLGAQSRRAQRRAVADDVIVNDGDLQQLRREIEKLHRHYLALAAQQGRAHPPETP